MWFGGKPGYPAAGTMTRARPAGVISGSTIVQWVEAGGLVSRNRRGRVVGRGGAGVSEGDYQR
jgi:hypothetical protein